MNQQQETEIGRRLTIRTYTDADNVQRDSGRDRDQTVVYDLPPNTVPPQPWTIRVIPHLLASEAQDKSAVIAQQQQQQQPLVLVNSVPTALKSDKLVFQGSDLSVRNITIGAGQTYNSGKTNRSSDQVMHVVAGHGQLFIEPSNATESQVIRQLQRESIVVLRRATVFAIRAPTESDLELFLTSAVLA